MLLTRPLWKHSLFTCLAACHCLQRPPAPLYKTCCRSSSAATSLTLQGKSTSPQSESIGGLLKAIQREERSGNPRMATVPSAVCLLAKNHFNRCRLNSASSSSSSSSFLSCGDLAEQEKATVPYSVQVPVEKCWWLKKFFVCEAVSHPATEPSCLNGSGS
ncbi:pancreatic progenitor cell differentiation and proliferation factor-like protein [Arapaima gigas]